MATNHGPYFLRATMPFIGVSTISIILRLWSRLVSANRRKYWWDDWAAVAAWVGHCATLFAHLILWTLASKMRKRSMLTEQVTSTALLATVIPLVRNGMGKEQPSLSEAQNIIIWKLTWADWLLSTTSICLVKISALLFYARVFNNVRWFRRALFGVHALTMAWFVTFFCTAVFECIPVHAYWDNSPANCTDSFVWFLVSYIFNLVLDLTILLLPSPMLWRLNCSKARKAWIALAFVLGYLAIIPAIAKLISVSKGRVKFHDSQYSGIRGIVWLYIEPAIDIVSICAPSWFHLMRRAKRHGVSSLFTTQDLDSKATHATSTASGTKGPNARFHRFRNGDSDANINEMDLGQEIPLADRNNAITVTRRLEVSAESV